MPTEHFPRLQPQNPGDNRRKQFRDRLRKSGLLQVESSESGSESDPSNLSPDDPIFDGCRDSDDTYDWNPEVKRKLKSYRASHYVQGDPSDGELGLG